MLHPPELHPYWIDLLRRIGVPTARLDAATPTTASAMVVLAPDGALDRSPALRRRAARLCRAGIPVVAGARDAAALVGGGLRRPRIAALRWGGHHVRLGVRAALHAGATEGLLVPSGRPAVARLIAAGQGPVLALPLPDAHTVLLAPSRRTTFPAGGGRLVHELATACDHGALRRLLAAALRRAFAWRGLPWLHLGPAPGHTIGACGLRIDADGFDGAAIERLALELVEAGLRATWFIDVERHVRGDGLGWVTLLRNAGHEVQTRAWRRHTYRGFAANCANLARGLTALRASGAVCDAAAAPSGTWNAGLHRAYRALGLVWSSECGRLHDEVPALLPGPGGEAPLWQVAVHPVRPSRLRAAGLPPAEIARYFATVVRRALRRAEPALLCGHPSDDPDSSPGLLPFLRRVIAECERRRGGSVWLPTLGELRAFAAARHAQRPDVVLEEGGLWLDCGGPAPIWLHATDGTVCRLPHRTMLARVPHHLTAATP